MGSDLLKKAYDLRERASEREKLYILAHYYGEGTGEVEKKTEVYEQWHHTYPRDTLPLDNLALNYAGIGLPEKAISAESEAMRLGPKDNYAYQNLANAYVDVNRYDEAKSVRGQAFLRLRDGTKAAAEFQKILDHRGAVGFSQLYPLSHVNLGRAYVQQGDTAKARTAYQDFFALWKDADPDIPVLKQAKAEYAKLQ